MDSQVSVLLTGLNGYGEHFAKELLLGNQKDYRFVAVVSRNPEKSSLYEELVAQNVAFYRSIEDCFANERIDLTIIATPMHIHKREVTCALLHGSNVYCEKPLAPTIDDCLELKSLSESMGCFVAVGYQWSFSNAITSLKKDILNNRYGSIQKMKTLVSWNRPKSYYSDSSWKGKNVSEDGTYILDNIISNTTAHYLHNLFYLCGPTADSSIFPETLSGEGYQAHSVDSFDTTFLKFKTENNIDLYYLGTVVSQETHSPIFELTLEHAIVYYIEKDNMDSILVTTDTGETITYGSPDEDRFKHIFKAITAVKDHTKPICDITTILPGVIAVNAAIENIPVCRFPTDMIEETDNLIWVPQILDILENCYDSELLPSELNYSWANKAPLVNIKDYRHFSRVAENNM